MGLAILEQIVQEEPEEEEEYEEAPMEEKALDEEEPKQEEEDEPELVQEEDEPIEEVQEEKEKKQKQQTHISKSSEKVTSFEKQKHSKQNRADSCEARPQPSNGSTTKIANVLTQLKITHGEEERSEKEACSKEKKEVEKEADVEPSKQIPTQKEDKRKSILQEEEAQIGRMFVSPSKLSGTNTFDTEMINNLLASPLFDSYDRPPYI